MNFLRPFLLAILGAFSAAAPAAPAAVVHADEGDKYTDTLDRAQKGEHPRPPAALDAAGRGDAPLQPSADAAGSATLAPETARPTWRAASAPAPRPLHLSSAPSIQDVRAGFVDLPPPSAPYA